MQLVRMYTQSASIIHLGKDVIHVTDGAADVPEHLIPHLLAAGWSRTPPNPAPVVETFHALDVPDVAAIDGGEAIGERASEEVIQERVRALTNGSTDGVPFSVVP